MAIIQKSETKDTYNNINQRIYIYTHTYQFPRLKVYLVLVPVMTDDERKIKGSKQRANKKPKGDAYVYIDICMYV